MQAIFKTPEEIGLTLPHTTFGIFTYFVNIGYS